MVAATAVAVQHGVDVVFIKKIMNIVVDNNSNFTIIIKKFNMQFSLPKYNNYCCIWYFYLKFINLFFEFFGLVGKYFIFCFLLQLKKKKYKNLYMNLNLKLNVNITWTNEIWLLMYCMWIEDVWKILYLIYDM